ncbi:MAG: hypothetical protein LH473_12935 [Chitinophagales bacterium]|nr:hypothetical protein [Chitinophagales bacterium]
MKTRLIHSNILLFSITVLLSCHAAKKYYESGDFGASIERSVSKLKKDPTDNESKIYLEAAYDKLYLQTIEQISFLKKEGRPENVLPVYDQLSQLKLYESMIRPLTPMYIESKKRYAQFKFVNDEEFIAAKKIAAEYLYNDAIKLLANNNRMDARQAYASLEDLNCIYPQYKDADLKMNEALDNGTNQVNLQIVNNSGAPLFTELDKQMTTLSIGDLNSRWVNFSNEKNSKKYFDYEVEMNVKQIIVTPDMLLPPTTYIDKKTIADGFKYELDSKGNVKKDSLGNDIKTPKYKVITCTVTEFIQQKSSTIAGTLDFFKTGNNSLLYSYPVDVHEIFENHYATAIGDLKALSAESAKKIKTLPAPYPTEIDMLLKVSDDLKNTVKAAMRDKTELVRN